MTSRSSIQDRLENIFVIYKSHHLVTLLSSKYSDLGTRNYGPVIKSLCVAFPTGKWHWPSKIGAADYFPAEVVVAVLREVFPNVSARKSSKKKTKTTKPKPMTTTTTRTPTMTNPKQLKPEIYLHNCDIFANRIDDKKSISAR